MTTWKFTTGIGIAALMSAFLGVANVFLPRWWFLAYLCAMFVLVLIVWVSILKENR